MDDPVERLIRDLRKETCPPAVQERVDRRLGRETVARHPWRPSFGWALASVSMVLIGAVVWRATLPSEPPPVAVAQAEIDRARVIDQTQGALLAIGQTLIKAAAHAEDALREDAVPPLLKSFRTVKDKISNPL